MYIRSLIVPNKEGTIHLFGENGFCTIARPYQFFLFNQNGGSITPFRNNVAYFFFNFELIKNRCSFVIQFYPLTELRGHFLEISYYLAIKESKSGF
jgi:hypothetical protein